MTGNRTGRGFHPARRLIDLANVVRTGDADAERLVEVLAAHGEDPDALAEFTETDAGRIRDAVDALLPALTGTDPDSVAGTINTVLAKCGARPRLSNHDGQFWHLHVDSSDDIGWGEWLSATGAHGLAQSLSERGRICWGVCHAADCGRLFWDNGPGSARRYCSPSCANRSRVALHRDRQAVRAAATG